MDGQPRPLGLLEAIAIVVGTVAGPGIFLTVSRPPAVVWIATGLLVLCGAAAFAKLATTMPESGGPYVFLRETYGSLAAFVFGWTFFFVVAGGTIAWLATIFAEGFLLGKGLTRAVAILFIGMLTWIHYRGSRAGARAQILFAVAQVATLGLAVARGSSTPQSPASPIDMLACLPAFAGWAALSFVAGEVRRPERTIRLAFLIGLGVCTVLLALPLDPGRHVKPMLMVLALGAANGWVMTAPWIPFAQARDHLFFRRFGEIHPRYGTPSVALLMQGVWAATLAITGLYKGLLAWAGLVVWFFYGVTALGARGWRHRAAVVLFLLPAFGYVIYAIVATPNAALAAALMTATGIPMYYIWRRFIR